MENKFFYAIKKKRAAFHENLLKSFGFSREENQEILQKSHLEPLFYNEAAERGFTVDKKGKDIKEKLRGILQEETSLAHQYTAKAEALRIQIKVEPSKKAEEGYYQAKEFIEVIQPLPNIYSWEQMAEELIEDTCCNDISLTLKRESTITQMMRQYNEEVGKLVKSKVDIALINTMLINFDDGKIYKLTVREATALGW